MKYLYILLAIFGSVVLVSPSEAAAAPKKWHPGHYIQLNSNGATDTALRNYFGTPGISGVIVYFGWRKFENTEGVYDFTEFDHILDLAAEHNKFVFIELLDKCANACSDPNNIIPQYIIDTGKYTPTNLGYTANVWDPWVTDKEINFIQAFAARYDNHPHFEGFRDSESAVSVPVHLRTFTTEEVRTQYMRRHAAMAQAFQKTNVYAELSYLGGGTEHISVLLNQMISIGGGVGWPDTLPEDCSQHPPINQLIPSVGNALAKQASMQLDKLVEACSSRFIPVSELYNIAVNTLGAHYVIWVAHGGPGYRGVDTYSWNDVKNWVPSHPTKTVCPTNITCMGGATSGSTTGGASGSTTGGLPPSGCNQYTPSSPIPEAFGSPFWVASNPSQALISVNCPPTGPASLSAGVSTSNVYVYKDVYVHKDGSWQKLTLSGAPAYGGTWYQGTVTAASLPFTNEELTTQRYAVAYVCTYASSQWKCGCRTSACTGADSGKWSLMPFRKP